MKIREDFVTNSSSSSFIIACNSKEDMEKTVREKVIEKNLADKIIKDLLRNSRGSPCSDVEQCAKVYAWDKLYFNIDVDGWLTHEGSFVSNWEKNHPGHEYLDWEKDPIYKRLYTRYYNKKKNELLKALDNKEFVSIVRYADDDAIGAKLEQEIMPSLPITVGVINEH